MALFFSKACRRYYRFTNFAHAPHPVPAQKLRQLNTIRQ
jgi:hypothetical protein